MDLHDSSYIPRILDALQVHSTVGNICATLIVCQGVYVLISRIYLRLLLKIKHSTVSKKRHEEKWTKISIAVLICAAAVGLATLRRVSADKATFVLWAVPLGHTLWTCLEQNQASRFRAATHGAACSILMVFPKICSTKPIKMEDIASFKFIVACVLFCGFLSVARGPDALSHGRPVDRQHSASLLELVTFSWAGKILKHENLESIEIKNLPLIHLHLGAEYLSQRYIQEHDLASPRLAIALARSHASSLALQWSISIFQSFIILTPHSIMYRLLQWMSDGPQHSASYGLALASLLGVSVVVEVFVESWLKWVTTSMIRLPIEAKINSMIYRKALRLPSTTHGSTKDLDKSIVAQMTTYSTKASILYSNGHLVLVTVTKLVSTTALLVNLVGWTGLALGLLAGMLVSPVTAFISGKYNTALRKQSKFHQLRQTTLTEALLAVRQIKISASEETWKTKINELRAEELKQLLICGAWMTTLVFAANISPDILSGIPIYVSNLQGNKLTAAVAFTSIGLFTQLQHAVAMLPITTPPLWEAWDYLQRLEIFFSRVELNERQITRAHSVSTDKAVVTWHSEKTTVFSLNDLSIQLPDGELSIVTGSTGSGKSLLLASLASEAKLVSGSISRPYSGSSKANREEKWVDSSQMAIVSQTPWMDDTTIQENIVLGLPFNQHRYSEVLECCALNMDLVNLQDGDATKVGMKGVALSGGQRWRISLARALYSRAQFIIMDDVLSAVDAEVRQWIVDKALFGNLAAGRTRILVTHHASQCADKAAYRIHLSQGTAKATTHFKNSNGDVDTDHLAADKAEASHSQKAAPAKHESGAFSAGKTQSSKNSFTSTWKKYFEATGGKQSWSFTLLATGSCAIIELQVSGQLREWASSAEGKSAGNLSQGTVYLLLATLKCFITAVRCFVWYKIGLNASKRLFDRMLSSIFGAPLQWLEEASHGEVLTHFGSEMNTIDTRLPHDLGYIIECFTGLSCILLTNASASIYDILLIILLCWLYAKIGLRLTAATRMMKSLSLKASSQLQQHLSALHAPDGIMTVRVYGMSAYYIDRMHRLLNDTSIALWHSTLCHIMADVQLGAIGALFVAASSLSLVSTGADAGTAGIALSFAMTFRKRMTGWLQRINTVDSGLQNVQQVAEYALIQQEPTSGIEVPDSWPAEGCISFEGLTAAYRGDSPAVLKNLTFSIKQGERIGVVGRTGAGKSSLTLALARLIEVREGRIVIDGIDISSVDVHVLRQKIFVIPQDPYLFRGTLRSALDPENVYKDEDLLGSLDRVQLSGRATESESVFRDLSFKLEDGGRNISQGQRQIVYLAKALLTRRRIIVMDEATSAVDTHTDTVMQTSIRELLVNTTVVVVAHRLATIADFDRVLVLDAGEALEFGAPIDLYGKKGMFWKLVQHSAEKDGILKKMGYPGDSREL